MRKLTAIRLYACLMVTIYAVCFSIKPVLADQATVDAQKFIQQVSHDAILVMSSNLSSEKKESKLTNLFIDSVDTKWMARFAMGKYWKEASDVQRNKYIAAHQKFLLKSYIPKFKEYNNQEVKINKTESEGDGQYRVETKLVSKDGTMVNIDYKVKKNDKGKFMIFDVVAEGVSLITTQRSDFASVLSREGVEVLLEKLTAKS